MAASPSPNPSPSPTVRRKRLGMELRRLRERAELTCEQVGRRLECSGTRISRIETGRINARPGDVRELLETYGVTGPEADSLVQLAREARRRGWWHAYGPVLPPWFETYLGMEAEAARLRDFQPLGIPALLQTEDYAHAVLRSAPGAGRPEDISRQVALRMQRQSILGRVGPPRLSVVLGESALRAVLGGPAVMGDQLRHLAQAAQVGNVELHVLPLTSAAHAQPIGPFTILEFPERTHPAVVYVEHLTGGLFLEGEPDIRRYAGAFGHLRAEALSPDVSADLIARAAGGLT
jgi:transcriptional regulator with XRE-family HTH domain